MIVWRIAAETRSYTATDLSGEGAALSPGRWNVEGVPVVYAASSIALATLETAAHLGRNALPLNRFLVRIQVPEAVWAAREEPALNRLPATWMSLPAGAGSAEYGSAWLAARRSALLLLPSVIVPEERIVLINPRHAEARGLRARVARAFEYDRLFRAPTSP